MGNSLKYESTRSDYYSQVHDGAEQLINPCILTLHFFPSSYHCCICWYSGKYGRIFECTNVSPSICEVCWRVGPGSLQY